MNIQELKTKNSKISYTYMTDNHYLESYDSIIAPPLIDQVWINLVKLEIYKDFWLNIFGGFLDRKCFTNVTEETEQFNYSRTLLLLDKYADILNPWYALWPDYESKMYLQDSKWFVYVSIKKLFKISDFIEQKCKSSKQVSGVTSWTDIAEAAFTKFVIKNSAFSVEEVQFSKQEIKLYDKLTTTPKNMFKMW